MDGFETLDKMHIGLDNLISELRAKKVSVETVFKGFPLGLFLAKWDLDRLQREAGFRVKKYLIKRGFQFTSSWDEDLNKLFENKLFQAYYSRLVLDHVLNYVLGYLGLAGGQAFNLRIFGYQISKIIKEKTASEWVQAIEEKIRVYGVKNGFDEETLKIIAMVSAMVSYQVRKDFYEG
jgi:hypothetical protein